MTNQQEMIDVRNGPADLWLAPKLGWVDMRSPVRVRDPKDFTNTQGKFR